MVDKSDEYVLDFVIPSGAIGPTGPTDPGIEPNICFISYARKNNTRGDLSVANNKIILLILRIL